MVEDRLVCPTLVELAGSQQLVHDNFPFPISYWDQDEELSCGFRIDVPTSLFFRWAVQEHGGVTVIRYCLSLNLMMMDPPRWMKAILEEQSIKRLWDASP